MLHIEVISAVQLINDKPLVYQIRCITYITTINNNTIIRPSRGFSDKIPGEKRDKPAKRTPSPIKINRKLTLPHVVEECPNSGQRNH